MASLTSPMIRITMRAMMQIYLTHDNYILLPVYQKHVAKVQES